MKVIDDNSFWVHSPDSDKTYKVFFGDNEKSLMPSCECYDWLKYYWPCKHFCAVFRLVPSHGWDKLSRGYRDSPFFKIDEEVCASVLTDTNVCHHESGDETTVECVNDSHAELAVSCDGNKSTMSACVRTAANCRESLRTLNDLTFLCTDEGQLRQLQQQLDELSSSFRRCLPQQDGLLLQLPVSSKRGKAKKRVTFACDSHLAIEENSAVGKRRKSDVENNRDEAPSSAEG